MTPVVPAPHGLQGLPTLTEVIEMPPRAQASAATAEPRPDDAPSVEAAPIRLLSERPNEFTPGYEGELVEAVLTDLQRHADLLLEYRLREALAPTLARLSDTLIRDLQVELAATMRDVVEYAVSQQLARRRGR